MSTLLCWNNLINGASYTMDKGTDSTNAPVSNAWNGRTARPAFPVADANGDLQITFDLTPSAIAYGELPYGYGPYGGVYLPDTFIIGAARHDPIGYRFAGGNVLLEAYIDAAWVTVLNEAMVYPVKNSVTFPLIAHAATLTYRLTISGQTALTAVPLPELFLGEATRLGSVDPGFDPYGDRTEFKEFNAQNGYDYRIKKFSKFTAKPSWSVLSRNYDATVDFFRETMIENLSAFWWVYDDTIAHKTFLVNHRLGYAAFPIQEATYRSFSLDLREVL